MMRMVWRMVGMGIVSAVALGCGGGTEQDERGAAGSGGTGGAGTGGEGGTGATSSAGGSGDVSGGTATDGAGGTGGVTGGTGGSAGGTSSAGGADGGTNGTASGGASGRGGLAGGAGGPSSSGGRPGSAGEAGTGSTAGQGGGSAAGGVGGVATGGVNGGGGVTEASGGVVNGGAGGTGSAAGEAGTGGTGGITTCSEPSPAVQLLRQGWWLCGWSGGLDHYSWVHFGTTSEHMATLAILDATCTSCTSYFGCAGTDGEYSAGASMYWVALAMPSGCMETDWAMWEMTEICPPDGYPVGSSAYVTLTTVPDRTTSLRCDMYPLDQCDATLSSCPMPL